MEPFGRRPSRWMIHVITGALLALACNEVPSPREETFSSQRSPATAGWQATGSLAEQRVYHSATALGSGDVLVAGGWSYNSYLATATLYSPASGTWAATGSMVTPRQAHTATRLQSGKVLVTGGENFGGYTGSAELYDPTAGTWSPAGSLTRARGYATATELSSGNVLVAGGLNHGGAWTTADVYNLSTGTWSSATPMRESRRSHTATRLPSGKVLVTGGWGGSATATCELYDPASGTWSYTGSFAIARYDHTATLLPSGKVLVTGGQNAGGTHSSAELYDPAVGSWVSLSPMASARAGHTATLLSSGKVLVAGGLASGATSSAELFDPAAGTWTSTASLVGARAHHTATLLSSPQRVLVTAGWAGSPLSTAELFTPPPSTDSSLVGRWTFENGSLADSTGHFGNLTLANGASVQNGSLVVNAAQRSYARSGNYSGSAISTKTLVAWVRVDDLFARGGTVLTLQRTNGSDVFDGIIYAEARSLEWMAGSDNFTRTDPWSDRLDEGPAGQLVQIAIAYLPSGQIILYRNGVLYTSYTKGSVVTYDPAGSLNAINVIFGLRHDDANLSNGFFTGRIEEAQLYNRALTQLEIQSLQYCGAASCG